MDAARDYAAACYRDAEHTLDVMSSAVSLFTPRKRNVLIVAGGGLPGVGLIMDSGSRSRRP
jgi:hypothetical protein